jgi:hypothetical protein
MSLTGHEPGPALFGNAYEASGGAACALTVPPTDVKSAFLRALVLRVPFTLLLTGAAASLLYAGVVRPSRWFNATVVGLAALLVALPAAALNLRFFSAAYPPMCGDLRRPAGVNDLTYEVNVSREFVAALEGLPKEVVELEVIHGFQTATPATPKATLSGDGFKADFGESSIHTVPKAPLIAALRRSPKLTLEAHGLPEQALMTGWQRNGLPDRRLLSAGELLDAHQHPALPLLEIRARETTRTRLLLLGGF